MIRVLTSLALLLIWQTVAFCDVKVNIEAREDDPTLVAFTSMYGYKPEVEDPDDPSKTIKNPKTRVEFAEEVVANFIREVAVNWEVSEKTKAIRDQLETIRSKHKVVIQ
jgi:hypothetical protein